MIYGKSQTEHDNALRRLLQRLRDKGITANIKKCIFNVNDIDFFGMRFSSNGMKPDPAKVEALENADPPTNLSELKSFLGMTNYSSPFIRNYSDKTATLRELLNKSKKWEWTIKHQQCFDDLKKSLQGPNVLGYFDVTASTKVIVDASPVGLGAMLVQTQQSGYNKVIAYGSRALNETEKRYSQIERECLAVHFGCTRFQMYLLGKTFILYTDHKPLVHLLNNPRKNSPFRVERIRLKLQGFQFTVEYLPGALNPTDYASRHPNRNDGDKQSSISDELSAYVNQVVKEIELPISLQDIEAENTNDDLINSIMDFLQKNKYPTKEDGIPANIMKIWDELSISDGLLLRQERIVIPEKLQTKIIKLAHEGHLGMVNTKRLLRSKVWFQNLDKAVEEEIKNCHACQSTVYQHEKEPLVMTEMPDGPWEHVKADFFGPLPSGDYILEVVDVYSRWAEIEIVRSTSASSTIPVLDKIFSTYGIPEKLTTDNGPPFNSYEFRKFTEYLGVVHKRTTPLWPQANATAENFNRMLRKVVQSAKLENKNWKQETYRFLRNYRATPHISTGKSPAEIIF